MVKKIVTSILIGNNYLNVIANEEINNSYICLYNEQKLFDCSTFANEFVKNSIKEIEAKILNKVEKINLIFDDYSIKGLKIESRILDKTFQLNKNSKKITALNENNYWDFQSSIKKDITEDNYSNSKKMIQLVPLKFMIKNFDNNKEESFSEFPIGKHVSEIKCYFNALYIANNFYEKILEMFNNIDVKFDNILLNSQLSFYQFNGNISDKLTFTLDIQEKKSMLLTSSNKIVISRNKLSYSFLDLVEKISKDFNISIEKSNDLIMAYGKIDMNSKNEDLQKIIYTSYDKNETITKKDLNNRIKSFLKTLTLEAKKNIETKVDANADFDINIVGKMEQIKNVDLYCSKYFLTKNVISNHCCNETYNNWKKSYQINLSLIKFTNIISQKINYLHLNKNNKLQIIVKKQNVFKFNKKKQPQMAII